MQHFFPHYRVINKNEWYFKLGPVNIKGQVLRAGLWIRFLIRYDLDPDLFQQHPHPKSFLFEL